MGCANHSSTFFRCCAEVSLKATAGQSYLVSCKCKAVQELVLLPGGRIGAIKVYSRSVINKQMHGRITQHCKTFWPLPPLDMN